MSLFGVDVSKWQGEIDWCIVKNKIDFAIIRGGFATTKDNKALYNMLECEKYSIPYGVYWFSYATNVDEATKEAECCLDFIKNRNIKFPVFFDFEEESINYAKKQKVDITPNKLCEMANIFCETISKAGYKAGIYSNKYFIDNFYVADKNIFDKFIMWFAYWGDSNVKNAPIWQFTNEGAVDGINGNVDCSYCYADFNNTNQIVSLIDIIERLKEVIDLLERGCTNGFGA